MYSSMTKVSSDQSGWGCGSRTWAEMHKRALEMHAFVSTCRPVGTIVTTTIEELCSVCDGNGIIRVGKREGRFCKTTTCKACRGTCIVGTIETIITTIGDKES